MNYQRKTDEQLKRLEAVYEGKSAAFLTVMEDLGEHRYDHELRWFFRELENRWETCETERRFINEEIQARILKGGIFNL